MNKLKRNTPYGIFIINIFKKSALCTTIII